MYLEPPFNASEAPEPDREPAGGRKRLARFSGDTDDVSRPLTEREMLNLLRLLLIAGNETTTNLIGNGVLALLRNPGELERLRDDPGLIPSAVEELLRYDSPAQATFRRALADCEVIGFPIRRRDNIVLLLGAASRDPDAVEAPDRLDVARSGRARCTASPSTR